MKLLAAAFTLHFIADFILQPRTMGKKKSESLKWLAGHLAIQLVVMAVGLSYLVDAKTALAIAGINAVVHGVVDWYIWRGYKWLVLKRIQAQAKKTIEYRTKQQPSFAQADFLIQEELKHQSAHWRYWEDHWFYVTIGFDQLLHGLTLIAVIEILKI
jgi:hypothetical protein